MYQWNGTDVFVGMIALLAGHTATFSTQNTTIYFDDVILGGSPGTPAIFQGSGLILSDSREIRCTVQVLDPLGHPPAFLSRIRLLTDTIFADDFESGSTTRWSTTVP